MKRAAVYMRVSDPKQAEEQKCSLETQLKDCEKHCRQKGYEVVKRYEDVQSGTDSIRDRDQFEQMLVDMNEDRFDVLVAWEPKRLFRNLMAPANLAKTMDNNPNVTVEGVMLPIDRSLIGMWGWLGEMELTGMKQRLIAGKRGSAEKNDNWQGGAVPYGYKYDGNPKSPNYTGKLQIDEEEAEVVRGLFNWVDGGKTICSWMKWANEQGIPTKNNRKGWIASTISRMIHNKAYTGQGKYGKNIKYGGKRIPSNEAVSLKYPLIVNEDIFNRVQVKTLEHRDKNRGSLVKSGRFYMLHQLGRCGQCGGRLGCSTVRSYRYLYCRNQRNYPLIHQCFKPQHIDMEWVENIVWGEIDQVLNRYKGGMIDKLRDRYNSASKIFEDTISKAQKELERCEEERQRVLKLYRKGRLEEEAWDLQDREVKADEDQWQTELARAEANSANMSDVIRNVDRMVAKVQRVGSWSWWADALDLTQEDKREILEAMLDEFIFFEKDGSVIVETTRCGDYEEIQWEPHYKLEFRLKVEPNEDVLDAMDTILAHDAPLISLDTAPASKTIINFSI